MTHPKPFEPLIFPVASLPNSLPTEPATVPPPPRTPRVRDLPCPKCDGGEVSLRYCDGCRNQVHDKLCAHRDPEHFHRYCRRCGHKWRTDDVPDAQVTCTGWS